MTDTYPTIERRRYWRIIRFFGRVIIHLVWWDILLRRLFPGRVRKSRPDRLRLIARRFRKLAIEMGGVMIKAGQFLSSRVDVLPLEITTELADLQDQVHPEPFEAIRQVIVDELGEPIESLFCQLDAEPQAAASLGQTHRVWLPALDCERGDAIILKVQRPGIEQVVETDLAALRVIARWVMYYPPIKRRANVPALVDEFARTTRLEIDYVCEADNADRFRQMFADDPDVIIPSVYRQYSTGRVLALQDVEFIKITDLAGIEAAGISRPAVAAKLFDIYLYQILQQGFFHADPHPGNLFVRPRGPHRPGDFQLVFVDFGMVGQVPELMGDQLREIMLALVLSDASRLARSFQALGFLLPSANMERVEQAIATLLDHFWGMNMAEMSQVDLAQMEALAIEFRDLLFQLPFQAPQDFVFLGRAIGILSGLCTMIDPQFNPWSPIEAYGQQLLRDDQQRPATRAAIETFTEVLRLLASLPSKMDAVLTQANRGNLTIKIRTDRVLERHLSRLELASRRQFWGLVFGVLCLSGTLLYIAQLSLPAGIFWGLAGASFIWGLLGRPGRN